MKITKAKIKNIIKEHLPEHSKVKIVMDKDRDIFTSFYLTNKIVCPVCWDEKTSDYPLNISLMGVIFHEIGHLVTLKKPIRNFSQLVDAEENAQKWAIKKAIELKQIELAKCLLKEFAAWGLESKEEFNSSRDASPFYKDGDVYYIASTRNEEWIDKKISQLFP